MPNSRTSRVTNNLPFRTSTATNNLPFDGIDAVNPVGKSLPPVTEVTGRDPVQTEAEVIQNSLDPFTQIGLNRNRSAINTGFGRNLADLSYNRGLSNLVRTRSIRDLTRTFNRSRETINPTFARRGLINSGLKDRALRRLTEERSRNLGDIALDSDLQSTRFDVDEQRLNEDRATRLGDVDLEEQILRAQLAAQLNQIGS